MTDVLRMRGDRSIVRVRGMAGGGIMADLFAIEAVAFSDVLGLFSGGELRKVDLINVHGIRVFLEENEGSGGLRVATLKDFDVHLLHMESLGLFDSIVDCGGNRGHG